MPHALSAKVARKNPFDQLICACARVQGLTLVTRDRLIIKWGGVPTLAY